MPSPSLAEKVLQTINDLQNVLLPLIELDLAFDTQSATKVLMGLRELREAALTRQAYSENERSRRRMEASASVIGPRKSTDG